MGYQIYLDSDRNRDLGYGVPAYCDHPDCDEEIDRGLSYVCGDEPYSNEDGCALYFCAKHLSGYQPQLCCRCSNGDLWFEPKEDHPKWINWKLTDDSWQQWRDENPDEVNRLGCVLGEQHDGSVL